MMMCAICLILAKTEYRLHGKNTMYGDLKRHFSTDLSTFARENVDNFVDKTAFLYRDE